MALIDGTASDGGWREDDPNDLFSKIEAHYGETPVALDNTEMENSKAARTEAAKNLQTLIVKAIKGVDDQIVVIAHSHGANVARLASQMRDVEIDEVIGLGGPVREDYAMNIDAVDSFINVYSNFDRIQE